MDIEKQFNLVAHEYDQNRRKFIACFDDFYIGSTKWIAANIPAPRRILDLGAGTGLLTRFWLEECPMSEYVLVDIAEDMLELARQRFVGQSNVSYQVLNYARELPAGSFDVVASALSIHHLEDEEKQALFSRIYDLLPPGGVFANYDQFCAGDPELDRWFDSYWEQQILTSGLSDHDLALWRERQKLDRECSVEQEIEMLRKCQFKIIKCIYAYQKFSVVIAIK